MIQERIKDPWNCAVSVPPCSGVGGPQLGRPEEGLEHLAEAEIKARESSGMLEKKLCFPELEVGLKPWKG